MNNLSFAVKTSKKALQVQHLCGLQSFVFWQISVVYSDFICNIAKYF